MNSALRRSVALRAARRAVTARRAAAALTLAAAAAVAPATSASAEQVPVLVAQHGSHQVWVSPDEPYDVPAEMQNAYWGFVPLDGMCGFAGTRLVLSDMRETFFIQEKANGAKTGSFTGIGKILDETFVLTQYDESGAEVRTYTGTGDEYAQFRGTGATGQQSDTAVNLRVVFRGDSSDGHTLSFSLKLRVRAEQERFEASVDSCHVR